MTTKSEGGNKHTEPHEQVIIWSRWIGTVGPLS